MEVVVIRPSTVYGPEDKGNVYKLIRWIDKGLPPLIGSGTNRKSMVYVHTLADALVFLSLLGKSGMAYVVTDGRDVTMREIVENICKSLGRRNRWPVFPCPAAKAVSRINEYLSGRIGLPLFLGRDMLERLVEETVFDPDPLFSLGFTPRYTFEEGIAETVQWYKRSIC
jgi:nucleoside-diphosphate-sugar epimerase